MEDIFRVCIMGRCYDIPTNEISSTTLEVLGSLADESSNINPRDLLRTFLEYSEINNALKNAILEANQKIHFNLLGSKDSKEANTESPNGDSGDEYENLSSKPDSN